MRGKRILALLCAFFMFVFGASGCSKANQADTDAVKAAVDKFRACTSFTVVHVTQRQETYTLDGTDFSYSGSSEVELSLITSPVPQIKTVSSSVMVYDGETAEQTNSSYVVPENGGYAEYISDGSEWYKLTSDYADALSTFNAASLVDVFFTDSISFGKAGTESIEGLSAARYEGALGGENLVVFLEANGLLYSISQMSENQQNKILDNLAKDLDDVTVSVWVDEASGYPIRFEVSLSPILSDAAESISKTLGHKDSEGQGSATEYVVSMSVRDFNALEEIVLPPEAADAKPYEEAVSDEG